MDVRLPRLGEGADSGVVASIFVKVGDRVKKDQPVLELESEKAVASIPAPAAGTVTKMHVKEGDEIKVGQLIFSLDEGTAPAPALRHPPEAIEEPAPVNRAEESEGEATEESAPAMERARPGNRRVEAQGLETAPPPGPARTAPAPHDGASSRPAPPAASPTVRKIARELGIDLYRVRGSERGGRIVMSDIRRYIQRLQQQAAGPAPRRKPGRPVPRPPRRSRPPSRWISRSGVPSERKR